MREDLFRQHGLFTPSEGEKPLTKREIAVLVEAKEIDEKLKQFLIQRTGNGEIAEDLAQEVWITIAEKISCGERIYASGLLPLAKKIGRGKVLNAFRKGKSHEGIPAEQVYFDYRNKQIRVNQNPNDVNNHEGIFDSSSQDPEACLLLKEESNFVKEVFDGLTQREKAIFEKDYLGYTDKEIAQVLEITPAHVRVIRHRAAKKLRADIIGKLRQDS